MLEREFNISPGAALAVLTWIAVVGLFAAGWLLGLEPLRELAVIAALVGSALTVLRDNAKTRRVVRAVARERQLRGDEIRPLR